MTQEDLNNLLLIVTVYGGMIVIAFWAAMVIWAYRDMRSRSRDRAVGLLAGATVALLNIPGVFIYILLRPRETLSEAYERSLEEEALLQEIEEKATCPGCGQRTDEDWQACPHCHTRLKKPCFHCGKMLELSWNLCPHCAASQASYTSSRQAVPQTQYTPPPQIPEHWLSNPEQNLSSTQYDSSGAGESLEFIDGDDY